MSSINEDSVNSNDFKRVTRSMTGSLKNNCNCNKETLDIDKSNNKIPKKRILKSDKTTKNKKHKSDPDLLSIFDTVLSKHLQKCNREDLESIAKYLMASYIANTDLNQNTNKNSLEIIDTNNENILQNIIGNIDGNENSNEFDDFIINDNNKKVSFSDIQEEDSSSANSSEISFSDEIDSEENDSECSDLYNTDMVLDNKNKSPYFKTLSTIQKEKLIETEKLIKKLNNYDIPIKYKILDSNLDIKTKAICMEKLESLQMLSEENGEFHKMKTWLDTLLKIPFNEYTTLPISINNQPREINEYLVKIYNNLNDAMYGQVSAKYQIIQYISQCITNPLAAGNVIGLCGPPGCGKTTLIKEGVSKAIDRPFSFITLGGSGGADLFEGHSYTYEGSTWGNIVSILIQSKCMNPIIYMDELDKISNTKEGKEISGILTHLTDPSQNKEFHDRYFANIDFDLSKALIIFSYNDESRIDPILKDRLKVIYTKGYSEKDKLIIVKDYMLKAIFKNIGMDAKDIQLSDEMIKYIISKTDKEEGVRNLKRSLETIISKINVLKLNSHNLLKLPFRIKEFKLPLTLTKETLDILMDKKVDLNSPPPFMYT